MAVDKPPYDALSRELQGAALVVVDASLTFDAVLGVADRRDKAAGLLATCHALALGLIAPPLYACEIDTATRQALHRGRLRRHDLPVIYAALDALPVQIVFDAEELEMVRQRAREIANLLDQPSVYDATYAALAERRGCQFWTADKTFANAARQRRRQADGKRIPVLSFVRYVGDY